jgi:flavin reductase (DIM6/NTAB) family NADH-FMN oxidoreductase RutF
VQIEFDKLRPEQTYHVMTQSLIPRPIAWVMSENEQGTYNLAPFSYFNSVANNPPLIMLSISRKPDGSPKDTRANIESRREFVVHIAHSGMLKQLNATAAEFAAHESEVEHLQLELESFPGSRLPRLRDCRVAYSCKLYQLHELGPARQALILGQVRSMYVDDGICHQDDHGRLMIDAAGIDPLARLGAREYMCFGRVVELERPR